MIEIAKEDSTEGMTIPDVLELATVGLAAMRILLSDLAKRDEAEDYTRKVLKGCDGMLIDILAEVENLEGVHRGAPIPTPSPTQAPDAIKDEGGVQPMPPEAPAVEGGRATPDDSPGNDGAATCPKPRFRVRTRTALAPRPYVDDLGNHRYLGDEPAPVPPQNRPDGDLNPAYRLASMDEQSATPDKEPGPSPCDIDPCIGDKLELSCDICGKIIQEVRELDEGGWDGILTPREQPAPSEAVQRLRDTRAEAKNFRLKCNGKRPALQQPLVPTTAAKCTFRTVVPEPFYCSLDGSRCHGDEGCAVERQPREGGG